MVVQLGLASPSSTKAMEMQPHLLNNLNTPVVAGCGHTTLQSRSVTLETEYIMVFPINHVHSIA